MTLSIRLIVLPDGRAILDFHDGMLIHCPDLAAAKDTIEKLAARHGLTLKRFSAVDVELDTQEVIL